MESFIPSGIASPQTERQCCFQMQSWPWHLQMTGQVTIQSASPQCHGLLTATMWGRHGYPEEILQETEHDAKRVHHPCIFFWIVLSFEYTAEWVKRVSPPCKVSHIYRRKNHIFLWCHRSSLQNKKEYVQCNLADKSQEHNYCGCKYFYENLFICHVMPQIFQFAIFKPRLYKPEFLSAWEWQAFIFQAARVPYKVLKAWKE